jgi:hypothetical protein
MNGRRLDAKTYIMAYQLCKYRDGEKCKICGGHIGDHMPTKLTSKWKLPTKNIERLEIDHVDGNPRNNPPDGSNWRLLCKADNLEAWQDSGSVVRESERERGQVAENKPGDEPAVADKPKVAPKRKGLRRKTKMEADREAVDRERKELRPATSIVRENVNYREGETSMQASAFLNPAWGKWIVGQLMARGFMPRKEAKNGGAYVTGGSPITMERYLETAESPQGPLERFTDESTGEVLIRFKARFLPAAENKKGRSQ